MMKILIQAMSMLSLVTALLLGSGCATHLVRRSYPPRRDLAAAYYPATKENIDLAVRGSYIEIDPVFSGFCCCLTPFLVTAALLDLPFSLLFDTIYLPADISRQRALQEAEDANQTREATCSDQKGEAFLTLEELEDRRSQGLLSTECHGPYSDSLWYTMQSEFYLELDSPQSITGTTARFQMPWGWSRTPPKQLGPKRVSELRARVPMLIGSTNYPHGILKELDLYPWQDYAMYFADSIHVQVTGPVTPLKSNECDLVHTYVYPDDFLIQIGWRDSFVMHAICGTEAEINEYNRRKWHEAEPSK